MTPPVGLPQLPPETVSQAPNAAASAGVQAAEPDATTAQFAAVLTLLLRGPAQGAPAVARPNGTPSGPADAAPETERRDEDGESDAAVLPGASVGVAPSAQPMSNAGQPTDASVAVAAAVMMPAAPAAGTAPDESSTTTPMVVRRDLDLLAPEFLDRLQRVIDRMESEYGYKVEVVETYRTQARQDALFAQGRTEPGQVVTWTRASQHTRGHAADLVVDGSYDDPVAYQRLMRIARDEGLRTLGARDPGHVELAAPRGATVVARPAPSVTSPASIVAAARELESPPPVAPVARVATIAPVAQVAQVARVARVAPVGAVVRQPAMPTPAPRGRATSSPAARDGDAIGGGTGATTQATATGPLPPLGSVAASSNVGTSARNGRDTGAPNDHHASRRSADASAARDSASDVLRQARDELMHAVAGTDPNPIGQSSPLPSDAAGRVGHADMTERIARLLKVHDAAGERPLSQVLLRLERPDGGEDRVRVDLRGNAVSATLDVTDAQAADRLGANVKELQRALERHGFETDSLTVRTASRTMETSALARAASASAESELQRTTAASPSGTFTNTSSRERGARHDEQRPSPDSHRHRSRREPKGER